jgi:hypothetical protein
MRASMNSARSPHVARGRSKLSPPEHDRLRVWAIQPIEVWEAINEQGSLLVDPARLALSSEENSEIARAYDWMRVQMARRISGYSGNYPWWAYEHFLDLRFYRWRQPRHGARYVRLGLDIPRAELLLSGYGSWHCVMNNMYLPPVGTEEETDAALAEWDARVEASAASHDIRLLNRLQVDLENSWERTFDVGVRRETETIQACFERLRLSDVVCVTPFVAPTHRSS